MTPDRRRPRLTPEGAVRERPVDTPPPVSSARLWIAILLPILLLAGVHGADRAVRLAGRFRDPAAPPTELVSVQRVLLKPEGIVATVLNESPQEVTIAQVAVDDAYWQFTADPGATLAPLRSATLLIPYPWVAGDSHTINLLLSTGAKFTYVIPVALATPEIDRRNLWLFTLVGLFVGVIPVALGLLWFPVLRSLGAGGARRRPRLHRRLTRGSFFSTARSRRSKAPTPCPALTRAWRCSR